MKVNFCIAIVLSLLHHFDCSYKEVKRLRKDLLSDYDPVVIPRISEFPFPVGFHLQVLKIRYYKVKEQRLSVTTTTMMAWEDEQLKWDPKDYNDSMMVKFTPEEIWIPDITLLNSATSTNEAYTDIYTQKIQVFSTGRVILSSPVIWTSNCQSDITWFPVDTQECRLLFRSESYPYTQLMIKPWFENISVIDSRFIPNGEWEIKETSLIYGSMELDVYPKQFSTMKIAIQLNHLSTFYFIYILIPLIVLCFLFLLIFQIPRNSGERLGFGVTILLSITVYLLVISDKLPEKSDAIPMLGIIFTLEFNVLCIGLAVAGINIKIGEQKSKAPPAWLLRCFKVKDFDPQINSCINENFQSDDDDKTSKNNIINQTTVDFTNTWNKIADKIDNIGFVLFTILVVVLPIIPISMLDRRGLK